MEFPAFEWIRISRKWNISVALEQWGLGQFQLKCRMGRMDCNKTDACLSRGKAFLAGTPFSPRYLFIYLSYIWFIKWQIEFREGFSLFSLFFVCFRTVILNVRNLPCFVRLQYMLCGQRPSRNVAFLWWAFHSISYASYTDFQSSFFPTVFFIPAGLTFFWP